MKEKVLVVEYFTDISPFCRVCFPVKTTRRKRGLEIAPGLYFSFRGSKNSAGERKPCLKTVQPIKFSTKLVEEILESYLSLLKAKREKISRKLGEPRLIGWRLLDT